MLTAQSGPGSLRDRSCMRYKFKGSTEGEKKVQITWTDNQGESNNEATIALITD